MEEVGISQYMAAATEQALAALSTYAADACQVAKRCSIRICYDWQLKETENWPWNGSHSSVIADRRTQQNWATGRMRHINSVSVSLFTRDRVPARTAERVLAMAIMSVRQSVRHDPVPNQAQVR